MSKLLNIEETATNLGLAKSTLYRWVHMKKIPYVKMGNLLKFKEKEILDFIEQKSRKAQE